MSDSGYNRLDFIRRDGNSDHRQRHRRIADDAIDGSNESFDAALAGHDLLISSRADLWCHHRGISRRRPCFGRRLFFGDRLCAYHNRIDRSGFAMQRRFIRHTISTRHQPNAQPYTKHATTTHAAQRKRDDLGQHAIGIVFRSRHRASPAKPAWL
ncbi:hypothetical protein [Dyella sp.]|uniref:hypothetical protein n=1 Tax=Dyella sp. TaxID=1869338 RepID=UPI002D785F8A|nr:hypothetical protein [Dyella sp.]HET7332774.1 hypothetical protein [Dyella sp.]